MGHVGKTVTQNVVSGSEITDGTVDTADLAENSITTSKITDANITTSKIADANITTSKIADANISTSKLANDSVTQDKIGADAVGTTELANDVAISTSGAITTTGAFTSLGINDDADANVLTINSSEAVGIGKSLTLNNYTGYQVLTMGGSDASTGVVIDLENSSGLINGQINASSGRLYLGVDPANANGGSEIVFEVDGSGKAKFDGSGNLNMLSGNVFIGTAGKGIDFSAQTLSSNIVGSPKSELLDHYETGQWNANVTSTSGSGSVTIYLGNPENQAARYVRIGSLVTVFGSHVVQSWGSRTGNLKIANLPFPVWAGGAYGGDVGYFPGDTRDASVSVWGSASYIQFAKNHGTQVGGTSSQWAISDLLTMKYLAYTFTYFTNIT